MVFIGVAPFGNLMSGALARGWGAPAAFVAGALLGLGSVGLLARRISAALRKGAPVPEPRKRRGRPLEEKQYDGRL